MSALTKAVLDSFFLAKRATEMLPPLPAGMKPRHIHVIDAVFSLRREQEGVKVSDISRKMELTMPSVTKLVGELRQMGVLEKYEEPADRRVVLVALTPLGTAYYRLHVEAFHGRLAQSFQRIGDEECRQMVATIEKIYGCLRECLKGDIEEKAEGEIENGRTHRTKCNRQ